MSTVHDPKASLDAAIIELGKELFAVKSNLAIYSLIGLNAGGISCGRRFFGHVQSLSLSYIALGLAKVFEQEKDHGLCSVRGVYRLACQVPIKNDSALRTFTGRYGIEASGDWLQDVDDVFSKQRPVIRRHMRAVHTVRHTRLAHLQQNAPVGNLPSVAAFEELLAFAADFHAFVNAAFLNTSAHPILQDKTISSSLVDVLKGAGVREVVSDFSDSV